jgi:hypothetical protein
LRFQVLNTLLDVLLTFVKSKENSCIQMKPEIQAPKCFPANSEPRKISGLVVHLIRASDHLRAYKNRKFQVSYALTHKGVKAFLIGARGGK